MLQISTSFLNRNQWLHRGNGNNEVGASGVSHKHPLVHPNGPGGSAGARIHWHSQFTAKTCGVVAVNRHIGRVVLP